MPLLPVPRFTFIRRDFRCQETHELSRYFNFRYFQYFVFHPRVLLTVRPFEKLLIRLQAYSKGSTRGVGIDVMFPYLAIKQLSSISTIGAYEDIELLGYHDPDLCIETSGVLALSFEQAVLGRRALNEVLRVPKALQTFQWKQQCNHRYHSCNRRTYPQLAQERSMLKESLQHLDLDIRGKKDEHLIGCMKQFKVLKTLAVKLSALCGDNIR